MSDHDEDVPTPPTATTTTNSSNNCDEIKTETKDDFPDDEKIIKECKKLVKKIGDDNMDNISYNKFVSRLAKRMKLSDAETIKKLRKTKKTLIQEIMGQKDASFGKSVAVVLPVGIVHDDNKDVKDETTAHDDDDDDDHVVVEEGRHHTKSPSRTTNLNQKKTEDDVDDGPNKNNNNEHHHSKNMFKIQRNKGILLVVAIFVCGAIIGGLVGWSISNDNGNDNSDDEKASSNNDNTDTGANNNNSNNNNTNGGNDDDPDGDNNNNNNTLFSTKEDLATLLSSISPDQGEELAKPQSPQSDALDWLWGDIVNNFGPNKYSEMQIIQRYVLATLYYSTTGEGWDDDLDFLSPIPECSWGVSNGYIPTWYGKMRHLDDYSDQFFYNPCNDVGSLTSLSIGNGLSGNDLSGTLPEELSLLGDLKTLQFRFGSSLYGSLSTHFGQLTKLQHFAIVDTQITGPIPSEFGQFRLLDYLDVSNNDLSGQLPTELGLLTSLDFFNIGSNKEINGTVPSELGGMRNASK